MFKYYAGKDGSVAKIALDTYNKDNSKLAIVEGQIVKDPSNNFLTLFAYLMDCDNIVKNIKVGDKWEIDPAFKFTSQVVKIELGLQKHTRESYGKPKEFTPTITESFIGEYLLEFTANHPNGFEGAIDLGIDRYPVDKYKEFMQLGEPGKMKALGYLCDIVNITPLDSLVNITPEILNTTTGDSNGGYKKGGNYKAAETESEKLNARMDFVKRFLSDNWDETATPKDMTLESCLAIWDGDKDKNKQAFKLQLLSEILQSK